MLWEFCLGLFKSEQVPYLGIYPRVRMQREKLSPRLAEPFVHANRAAIPSEKACTVTPFEDTITTPALHVQCSSR